MSNTKLKRKPKFDLKKKVRSQKDTYVKVGYPKESGETSSQNEGVTALEKAVSNNFGLGNNPERPFMDIAYSKNKSKYRKEIVKAYRRIETLDQVKFLNKLGIEAVGDIQETIISLRDPANSQATVDAKGSSNPLIDSGHMKQSTTYQVIQGKK